MMLRETLELQDAAWRSRPLVRRLSHEWFRVSGERLTDLPGPSIELGTGIGKFKEMFPHVVATDVEKTPWAEAVVDAEALPFDNGELANIILVDVFHHLPRPGRFLDE